MVVAKFNVTKNKVSDNATDANDIALHAVYGESEENKNFFKWTPSAQILMSCVNPAANEQFEEGKAKYVVFMSPEEFELFKSK